MPPSAGDIGAEARPIAVVGVGPMGSRIAGRLLAAGRELVVWNRTRERAELIGAETAPTPAAAAEHAGVVTTSLSDAAARARRERGAARHGRAPRRGGRSRPRAPPGRGQLFGVLATTPLAQQAERRRQALAAGDYPPRFAFSLAREDADLIADAGADLRLAAAVRSWLAEAEAAGLGS